MPPPGATANFLMSGSAGRPARICITPVRRSACLLYTSGAAIFVFINARYGAPAAAVLISAMLTAAVRAAAIAFDLNLPVIKVKRNSTEQIEQSAVSSVGNSKIND